MNSIYQLMFFKPLKDLIYPLDWGWVNASIAQLVEHAAVNRRVIGSIPIGSVLY